MNRDGAITLCKYYKGEELNPFLQQPGENSAFWEFEKMLVDHAQRDNDFIPRLVRQVEDYIKSNPGKKDIYTDEARPIEQRAVILYCDLMAGKWFHAFEIASEY